MKTVLPDWKKSWYLYHDFIDKLDAHFSTTYIYQRDSSRTVEMIEICSKGFPSLLGRCMVFWANTTVQYSRRKTSISSDFK